MIEFNRVYKAFETKMALQNINLHIEPGEMVFIQGHSGAGKSTLLKLIAALEPPSSGQLRVNQHKLNELCQKSVPHYRRKLGLIFQSPLLLEDRTIYENVALPLMVAGFDYQEAQRRVRGALHQVGLLGKIQDYPHTLSSGEQQRVSIARAVVHRPDILLADEPTGNLDPKLSIEIMKLFQKCQQVGVTVIIASHDTYLLNHFNIRKVILHQGQVHLPHHEEFKAHG